MPTKKFFGVLITILALLCPLITAAGESKHDDELIVLTCWVYYNGVQEHEFNQLLQEFNDTVGLEQGVFVESRSQGNISELTARVVASANREVGAELMPDLFMGYADTTYQMLDLGMVADLSAYLSKDELDTYIDAYIEEGRMGSKDKFYIFPTAKSTEILLLNQTAWDEFVAATEASEESLLTWEGITELSKAYFEWTDSQTPEVEGDGAAFFGRDVMANYLLIGSRQLGSEIFSIKDGTATVKLDRAVMKKLWDHFYVPYVNGWFGSYGRFRSDDIKTGQIIALVGSSSGAKYFPTEVSNDEGISTPIQCSVRLLPNFEGTQPMATQQGAGFVVVKSTPERERAAVTFLKWLTEPERNILFSLESGYMPVTKEGTNPDTVQSIMQAMGTEDVVQHIVQISAQISTQYMLYTTKPFKNASAARNVLETSLLDEARAARERLAQLQNGGANRTEALAELTSENHFDEWFQKMQTDLEQVLANESRK